MFSIGRQSAKALRTESATDPYQGGLTYSGHVLAMCSVIAAIKVMQKEHLLENCRTIGT